MLAKAKGFRFFRSTHFRYAKDAVRKAMTYAYRDRKVRKRSFRNLWIQRINAAARPLGITYSRMMEGLKFAGILVDRKVLADLAVNDLAAFAAIAEQAKAAVAKKASAA
jgi:large subunit ribosomal protein L20